MSVKEEWDYLCNEHGTDAILRWFYSFKGYEVARQSKDFEEIKNDLLTLI